MPCCTTGTNFPVIQKMKKTMRKQNPTPTDRK